MKKYISCKWHWIINWMICVRVTWSRRFTTVKMKNFIHPLSILQRHYEDWSVSLILSRCTTHRENHVQHLQLIHSLHLRSMFFNCMNIDCVTCPNHTRFNAALPRALNNTHVECEADQMNGSPETWVTYKQISGIIRQVIFPDPKMWMCGRLYMYIYICII